MLGSLLLLLCSLSLSSADWYSSVGHMEDLMNEELHLLSHFKQFIAEEEHKLAQVKAVMDDLTQEVQEAVANPEGYLGNPVNQYILMKRLNLEFNLIDVLMEKNDTVLNKLKDMRKDFPNDDDIEGSAKALMRLQKTYKLDTRALSEGFVKDSIAGRSLSAEDCFKIGKLAYVDNDFEHCALWMNEAYRKILEGEPYNEWPTVLRYLSIAHYELGNFELAAAMTADLMNAYPDNYVFRANYEFFNEVLDEKKKKNESENEETEKEPGRLELYEKLCREGGEPIPADIHKTLKCYFWTNGHPYLRIQPIKMEEMWNSPHIIRFYDIISDKEIEDIKTLAKPKLDRATVHNPQNGELENTDYRVSKTAWLEDPEHRSVKRVSQRISMVTGLSLATAESLQISNYGLGGQYEPHTDHRGQSREVETNLEKETGDRIATMLFYLSNVEYGGATVFLNAKIASHPIKGSAVFWYNLYPSGRGDARTRHAACPVLTGVKWVANKWIHEQGEEFRRPCGLEENADNRVF